MALKIRMRAWVVLLTTALVLAIALPALAYVSKSGNQACSGQLTPWTRGYSTGHTEHLPPGSGWAEFYNYSSWKVTRAHAPLHSNGGFWAVMTDGALDNPGTYAYCSAVE